MSEVQHVFFVLQTCKRNYNFHFSFFNNHFEGYFTLYKHARFPYEVGFLSSKTLCRRSLPLPSQLHTLKGHPFTFRAK